MQGLKVVYIYHDCFVVKTEQVVIVFDFWKDPYQHHPLLPNPLVEVSRDMPVYVFVSHRHKDHYNPRIFEWSRYFRNIKYVVSEDVRGMMHHILSPTSPYKGVKLLDEQVVVLGNGESYSDDKIEVRAYPSTDEGNSYSVRVGDFSLFHAGDLNAWIWKDESTEEEVRSAISRFESILDEIGESNSGFDICFFPVDSTIGRDYFSGATLFLERFVVGNFFPMHYELGEKVEDIARLHRDAASFGLYASDNCQHYIMSAPYSAYYIKK